MRPLPNASLVLNFVTVTIRSSLNGLAALTVAFTLTIGSACTRSSGPAPQMASDPQQPWDGGLPMPTPSTKKGVIVPTDVGAGTGPSGPGTSIGTNPSPAGSLQPPGGGN
jgi:hypothetical protein